MNRSIESLARSLDGPAWYARWEAMMASYTIARDDRFDLVLSAPKLLPAHDLRILDLGCGPGSLSFRAGDRFPAARILAVDFDPVLLEIGRQVAQARSSPIEFRQADIRDDGFWKDLEENFDLAVSATALHWLNAENHSRLYHRIFRALAPGGWFVNSDHVAGGSPELQERNRRRLEEQQRAAFAQSGAMKWDEFWSAMQGELGKLDLAALRNQEAFWEGTDDGHQLQFHRGALKASGFAGIEVLWRELGEAVLGARKPPLGEGSGA